MGKKKVYLPCTEKFVEHKDGKNNDAFSSCENVYRGADKSLARPTSRCIVFDGENISFDASLVIYIYIYICVNCVQGVNSKMR